MRFKRYLSAAVLMVWGVMFCFLYFSGRLSGMLHPTFEACTAVAGVVLVLMAVARLFAGRDVEEVACGNGLFDGGVIRQTACAVFLTAPLLIAAAYAPNSFDATAILNRGFVDDIENLPTYNPAAPFAGADTSGSQANPYMPRDTDGNIKAQPADLLYAAEEPSMRSDFENQKVELIGQYMPATANNASGDRFKLVRMYSVCCASDARPVAVMVQAEKPEASAELSWVRVTGKATFPVEGGRRIPVVVAESVKPCDPPEETFIY